MLGVAWQLFFKHFSLARAVSSKFSCFFESKEGSGKTAQLVSQKEISWEKPAARFSPKPSSLLDFKFR